MGRPGRDLQASPAERVVAGNIRRLVRVPPRGAERGSRWGPQLNETRPEGATRRARWVLAALTLGALSLSSSVLADDIALKAPPQPVLDWSGLYFGAHAGFGRAFSNAMLADPAVAATGNFFGGPVGGLQ